MIGGRGGGDDLGSPPPLEDLPIRRVLILVRRDHHQPFALVQGGWCGCSLDHGEGHNRDGRWRVRRVSGEWRGKILVGCCVGKVLGEGCCRSGRSRC